MHVGLAESLTVLQSHEMTVVVVEADTVPSDLEVVLSVVPACLGLFEVLHSY